MALASGVFMLINGNSFSVFADFDAISWCILAVWALFSVLYQTFKFMALQYEMPGKLAHYQYLSLIYQLIFDLLVTHRQFSFWQWIGLSILMCGYMIQAWQIFQKFKSNNQKEAE